MTIRFIILTYRNEPLWIGIHATDSQGQSLEWADCVPTTWTQWHPSEPKSPDIYQCAYLKSFTTNMWMDTCSETKNFICENIDSSKYVNYHLMFNIDFLNAKINDFKKCCKV